MIKKIKWVEIKINVPGDDFVVKKQCKTFEEAVDLATESLERLLVKRKEKIRTSYLNMKFFSKNVLKER